MSERGLFRTITARIYTSALSSRYILIHFEQKKPKQEHGSKLLLQLSHHTNNITYLLQYRQVLQTREGSFVGPEKDITIVTMETHMYEKTKRSLSFRVPTYILIQFFPVYLRFILFGFSFRSLYGIYIGAQHNIMVPT